MTPPSRSPATPPPSGGAGGAEHPPADDVPDREDGRARRAQGGVHLHVPFRKLDSARLEPEPVRQRLPPHGDEELLRGKPLSLPLEGDDELPRRRVEALRRGA